GGEAAGVGNNSGAEKPIQECNVSECVRIDKSSYFVKRSCTKYHMGDVIETLGKLPGTNMFCDVHQYPMAMKIPGIVIVRIKSSMLCFSNANSITERVIFVLLLQGSINGSLRKKQKGTRKI
ncbi:hypothetical protein Lal_00046578, partial [Lupinus albus]